MAWRRRKDILTKGSVNQLSNDKGVCRTAPGFARVCYTWFKCRENKQFGFEKSIFRAESDSYGNTIHEKYYLRKKVKIYFINIFSPQNIDFCKHTRGYCLKILKHYIVLFSKIFILTLLTAVLPKQPLKYLLHRGCQCLFIPNYFV